MEDDTRTGLAILAGAIGSAGLIEKALGPTADYIGNGIRLWTEKGVQNVARIFQCAIRKLGDDIDTPGSVPPRVLKGVLSEGAFVDDAIAAEYFGGVLASARSAVPGDDRAVGAIAQIARMSSYQLRAHFVIYATMGDLYAEHNLGFWDVIDLKRMGTFFPTDGVLRAMGLQDSADTASLIVHTLIGLGQEGLIDPGYTLGKPDAVLEKHGTYPESSGLAVWPTHVGCQLMLWAAGKGRSINPDVFPSEMAGQWLLGVEPMEGATPMQLLPKSRQK